MDFKIELFFNFKKYYSLSKTTQIPGLHSLLSGYIQSELAS